MLERKIQSTITKHFQSDSNKVLVIDGARQIGKTYIIRHVGKQLFKNFVEINLLEDSLGGRVFEDAKTIDEFYFRLSLVAGEKLGSKKDTLVFLDEIQAYPHLLTLLKFLKTDDRFTYVASGSLLGVTLAKTSSIPIGSIEVKQMFPLDFEEFLWANGVGKAFIENVAAKFKALESLDETVHERLLSLFKRYLLVGGLPDVVNHFIANKNVFEVRSLQSEIHDYYALDASKYDEQNRLKIRRIYDMVPSNLANKKKRIVIKDIENKVGKRFKDYEDEFDYLIHSGIALEVRAISNPSFPLIESTGKNLLKLYLSDVGILTNVLYKHNALAIMNDVKSVNLGAVYESVVAQELSSHGVPLYYYDNKSKGEVDFLFDDYDSLSVVPIEVKSGKDYNVHSALDHFVANDSYAVKKAYVLSNEREVVQTEKIIYLPIYYVMFFSQLSDQGANFLID